MHDVYRFKSLEAREDYKHRHFVNQQVVEYLNGSSFVVIRFSAAGSIVAIRALRDIVSMSTNIAANNFSLGEWTLFNLDEMKEFLVKEPRKSVSDSVQSIESLKEKEYNLLSQMKVDLEKELNQVIRRMKELEK
ncbi:MAG: hypothetical protein [Caudoviricetes sp.]|nr:MAG: hypothetical protein [Caudoviricetes sp.]